MRTCREITLKSQNTNNNMSCIKNRKSRNLDEMIKRITGISAKTRLSFYKYESTESRTFMETDD